MSYDEESIYFAGLDNSWRVSTLTFLNVCCIVHNMKP